MKEYCHTTVINRMAVMKTDTYHIFLVQSIKFVLSYQIIFYHISHGDGKRNIFLNSIQMVVIVV